MLQEWSHFLLLQAGSGFAVLLAAFAGSIALKRSSAALRHFVWSAAFGSLLLMPIGWIAATRFLPASQKEIPRELVTLTLGANATATPDAGSSTTAAPDREPAWLLAIWVTGAAIL